MEPAPSATKIRMRPGTVAKFGASWDIINPKPKLTISKGEHYDGLSTTAHVILTKANLEGEFVANNEAILFSNVLGPDGKPINNVAIDLPETGGQEYSFEDLKYIATKTFTAFLGCRLMGWTKIVTHRFGDETVDFIQIMSAWLAGISWIHFVVGEDQNSKAFLSFISRFVYEPMHYDIPDLQLREPQVWARRGEELYPIEKSISQRDYTLQVGDLIRFNAVASITSRWDKYVYGIVTKVTPSTVIFRKLRVNLGRQPDDESVDIVSPVMGSNEGTGMLRAYKDKLYPYDTIYEYEKNKVTVYTPRGGDRIYQNNSSTW